MASLLAHPGSQRLRYQSVTTANIQDVGLGLTRNILVNFVGNKLGKKKVKHTFEQDKVPIGSVCHCCIKK